jgi:hypothetical protein
VIEATYAALGSRIRWRSMLRSWLYRETAFAVLDPPRLTALFEAFACVVRLHPVVLYWVHRLSDQEYLVANFKHRSMVRYSGLELVHVAPDYIGYYRLPGAKVGGRGTVKPGVYCICIRSPGRHTHCLRIRKCEFGQLHLDEVCRHSMSDTELFLPLQRHVLDRSKFADEMTMLVEQGIEWGFQQALLSGAESLGDADWTELTGRCAGLSSKIDALLHARAGLRRRGP